MADPDPPDGPPDGPDLKSFAQDWITIWHSELAAAATDREAQEAWAALVAQWAGVATALAAGLPDGRGGAGKPHGCHEREAARTTAAAGSAPADPAPDPRDAEVERLARRVAELERRLADLERGGG